MRVKAKFRQVERVANGDRAQAQAQQFVVRFIG